ncbi:MULTISPECIES: dihydropyrimidinase [Paraburkholderia]|uniref:dihydropyrimidinase n=1 Tax=Paraburkholderia TaxID=1822464 RepID=UPI00037B1B17|nr:MULTISPECIES: dihydropyrimidinase [Paraburkholderia]MDH6147523.1 dihydropyrimidinase [Paraburkholderia sp. WSM4179]
MPAFDTVIRNARVVTAADIFTSDIGIRDGRIVALGLSLDSGEREIDAAGRHVTPGGVDSHVHFDQPTGDGSIMADDFLSGTTSAACGGTTTVIPFACQQKGHTLREAIDDYHRRAGAKAVIDYSFHMIITDPTPHILKEELPALIAEGYTSFKIYMTYDALKLSDRQMLDTLSVARNEGAMVMIHAENADCIAWLTERLLEAGHTAPRYHATSRPMLVEREATHRAIAFAELVDVPILIVHVSGREAVEQIRWAQSHGLKVYGETCPQYLFLTADSLGCDDSFEGAKCICSPPPRDEANQQVIWDGLENGSFEVFSSDHAPFRYDGPDGKKAHGENVSFDQIANGIPGVETRMALLWSEGVRQGRITPQSFVALTSTNAAKLYGLYPRKGSIAIGADADLVIWDEGLEFEIKNENLHHNVDYTPYEGMQLSAWPALTMARGEVVWDGQKSCGESGRGQFLPCARPDPAKPRRRKTLLPL